MERVLEILFIRFAAQPFSIEQLEGQATAYCPAAELVYGLHLLRRAGLVNTMSRGWGEPLYALSLQAYFEIQQKSFLLLEADQSRNERLQGHVKLLKEAKRGLAHDLLRVLSGIAKGALPLTAKGRVQQRALSKFTGLFSLSDEDLGGLQLSYPEQDDYPPAAAVLLDMALALGLTRKDEQAWAVNEHELIRWLRSDEALREGLLMAELLERYVPANPFLQHLVCALLHPAFLPGKWGSIEGILRQLRAKRIQLDSPLAGQRQEADRQETSPIGSWLLSWLKALCGFGWLELGYADEQGRGIPEALAAVLAAGNNGLDDEKPLKEREREQGQDLGFPLAGLMIRWLRKPDLKAVFCRRMAETQSGRQGALAGFEGEAATSASIGTSDGTSEGTGVRTDARCGLGNPHEAAFFVQPDYEVLVPPNTPYTIRWELELCCELISADVMTTYRLTRESVERAAENGRKAGEVLAFLERHALTGVPDAVSLAVREWGEQRKHTSLFHATLLHCADERTADRIAAEPAAEGALERIGSCHFIVSANERMPVVQMLEQLGVTLYNPLEEAAAANGVLYPRVSPALSGSGTRGSEASKDRNEAVQAPQAWIYAGKPVRIQKADASIPNLEELFPGLRRIPAAWTSEVRTYHASTVKLMLQQALEWKAGVELRLNNGTFTAVPRWIKGSGDWRVGAELAPKDNSKAEEGNSKEGKGNSKAGEGEGFHAGTYTELIPADIEGIRILLPAER
ncbi:helicase-associated domain-containing protein [Paenibacillus physcomitrellae]|nr:helicase-associated domain-containing protein [Paenibacillus physcomitrellae]